jgi:hypothetical protein
MTKQEEEYAAANQNPRAELDYAVANGTIRPEDALTAEDLKENPKARPATEETATDLVNEPVKTETVVEKAKGGK